MARLIVGLYKDWLWLDERIETVTGEIEELSHLEAKCQRLMSVPGIGPMISTALVAAIGTGEAFDAGATSAPGSALCPTVQHRRAVDPRPHLQAGQQSTCARC